MRLFSISMSVLLLSLVACSEYNVKTEPEVPEEGPATVPPPTVPPTPVPPTPTEPTPDIEVDRYEVNFGTLPPQCSATRSVNVSNVGDADLVISDITLHGYGDGFALVGGPLTLAPGASSDLEIDFEPTATASYFDAVDITSNDPDEPLVQVTAMGEGDVVGSYEEVFDQEGSALPIDILFVIDNSTSMGDENLALRNNFNSFMQGFLALNLDYQIGVVTTDMQTPGYQGQLQGPIISTATPNPVQQFSANADIPFTQVQEEQGLDAAYTALTAPLINGVNAGLVRPGSLLSVIVISDEDDQSVVTPAEMITLLDTYHGDPDKTSLSIVGGPRTGIFPCGSFFFGAAPVPTYWEVAQATGGIHLNLCNLNMATIVQQLAVVAAGLDTRFTLASIPPDPSLIEVTVDGSPLGEDAVNGWVYDPAGNAIVFAGTGIPPAGATIRVHVPDVSSCP